MKILTNRKISFFLSTLLIFSNSSFISFAQSRETRAVFRNGMEAEWSFYESEYEKAVSFFESLKTAEGENYALINNQLGSIYLAKQNYEKALSSFLEAYYLMNDIEAFSGLEARAISLMGSEAEKAYKGDPYEKIYNSLYAGLLLYRENDIDNALAAFKNGILAGSDIKADLYKNDAYLLYALSSRLSLKRGERKLSNQYFDEAVEAFYQTRPINRGLIAKKQAQLFLLKEKREEIEEIIDSQTRPRRGEEERRGFVIQGSEPSVKEDDDDKGPSLSQRDIDRIANIESEMEQIDENLYKLSLKIEENNKNINTGALEKIIGLDNNVFLCIEFGRAPLKYGIGQYGQLAVFTVKPSSIQNISVFVEDEKKASDLVSLSSDVYYQAVTRGGREMDGILEGQAQYKQATADMSVAMSQASQNIINQANQMAMQNPYHDASGAYAAAGIIALISLCAAIASEAANPAADVRHWSLMPGNLAVLPLSLDPGEHSINIETELKTGEILKDSINIVVQPNQDSIEFYRIFED